MTPATVNVNDRDGNSASPREEILAIAGVAEVARVPAVQHD
jgi:hypothetical protein